MSADIHKAVNAIKRRNKLLYGDSDISIPDNTEAKVHSQILPTFRVRRKLRLPPKKELEALKEQVKTEQEKEEKEIKKEEKKEEAEIKAEEKKEEEEIKLDEEKFKILKEKKKPQSFRVKRNVMHITL